MHTSETNDRNPPHPHKETKTNQHKPLIAVATIAVIIAVFALAFKKGYITIETVDEENPEETSDDYTI